MDIFRKYFEITNSEAEQNLGIAIHNLGHHIHPANVSYPDQKHPNSHYFDWEKGRRLEEYQILYIAEGEGYFEGNGLPPQKIEAGTVVLLYPDVWHRYRPELSTGWEEYWVGFSGTYAHYLLELECFNPQNPIIKVDFKNEFFDILIRMLELVEVKKESYKKMSSFLLIQILGLIYSSALSSKMRLTKKEELINNIRSQIHKDWNKPFDFEQIALTNNVSYVWFRQAFKEILETSPNQYLIMVKLRKAEQLIKETSFTLSEIAYQSGFESEFYFSRLFKKKMGYNPSELRKNKA